ncbi:MAG: hypothetical protein D3910_28730 [Candidatus Electrothrix sp. ATG2]|nr:hypothetical protein [Candidatus Electrothrix sp. ATG2]
MRLSISEKYLKKQRNILVTYSLLGGLAISFVFIVFGINIDSLAKETLIIVSILPVGWMLTLALLADRTRSNDLRNRHIEIKEDKIVLIDYEVEHHIPIQSIASVNIQNINGVISNIELSLKKSSTFIIDNSLKFEGYEEIEKLADFLRSALPEEPVKSR